MGKAKRNLAGSAYCMDCGARAEYLRDGTLGIRHAADCPALRRWDRVMS